MKSLLSFVFIFQCLFLSAQSPIFVKPLEGTYGEDFVIVNYVDWSADSAMDHQCGTKTYDGHQGTDFVISGFPQMDAGVNVQAVDSGVVVFIHDGEPDRNTDGNPLLGFGNYVAVKHPDRHFSYYAHLKKFSIIVNVGDTVSAGQNIAQIGSSGNSTDPHVHFELWYDSAYLIDPFAGPCGNSYSYWIDTIPYDTSFHVWEYGLTDYITPIDSLRERPKPRVHFSSQDSVITFWNLQYGLRTGDNTRIQWLTPAGDEWFSYTVNYQQDWWYYYFFSYIFTPPDSLWGEWTYNYYYNDSLVVSDNFTFGITSGTDEKGEEVPLFYRQGNRTLVFEISGDTKVQSAEVFTVSGQKLLRRQFSGEKRVELEIPEVQSGPGFYIVRLRHSGGVWTFKVVL